MARVREREPEFEVTAQNARAVAQVCAQLDGIPLALELAAARVGSLSVQGIAARLDDRFRLLTGGARDALPRHRTLRAALEWSHDQLDEPEQRLLDQLAVFVGGWTLHAAEAVCMGHVMAEERPGGSDAVPVAPVGISLDAPGRSHVGTWDVLDLLDGLVNKSLVHTMEVAGELRYGLLETVRQYGLERLVATGAEAAVRDRHLSWCLALAEEAEPHLKGAEQSEWLDRLEIEHDNLRAALSWARERQAGAVGLRLAGALGRFWNMRGYLGEGRSGLEGALAADDQGTPAVRAKALNAAGDLAAEQGDLEREVALQEEALELWRALENREGIAASLNRLAWVASLQGDFGRAVTLREECLALQQALDARWDIAYSLGHLAWMASLQGDLVRAVALAGEALALGHDLGDRWGIARSLDHLGRTVGRQGDLVRAAALLEEALALGRELGDRVGSAASIGHLGWVVGQLGDLVRAAALLEDCVVQQRKLGDRRGMARSLGHLGSIVSRQGDPERALALFGESLRLSRDLSARDLLAEGLASVAHVVVARGQPRRAARLGGAAEALRTALGMPLPPVLQPLHEQFVQGLRAALGEETFASAWAEGRSLPLDEALALALEGHDASC